MRPAVTSGISPNFLELSQSRGQVAHVLLTRSPLNFPPKRKAPFDLHVLSTPPAFVLSQDQTLRRCLNQAENRELALSISINPKKPTKRGCYLALTFGTLLSSQRADALVLQPFRPSFEAVSRLYTALRSGQTSGACPAVDQAGGPVRSRSVQGEQYTPSGARARGAEEGARPPRRPCRRDRRCSGERLWGRSSED